MEGYCSKVGGWVSTSVHWEDSGLLGRELGGGTHSSQREGGVVFRAERGSRKKFGGTQAKMSSVGT